MRGRPPGTWMEINSLSSGFTGSSTGSDNTGAPAGRMKASRPSKVTIWSLPRDHAAGPASPHMHRAQGQPIAAAFIAEAQANADCPQSRPVPARGW